MQIRGLEVESSYSIPRAAIKLALPHSPHDKLGPTLLWPEHHSTFPIGPKKLLYIWNMCVRGGFYFQVFTF